MDDVKKELSVFLDYVAGREPEGDDYIKRLKEAVKEAKKNREWRHEYVTLLMRDQENMEKGMELKRERIVSNALMSTGSVKQTLLILGLEERTVRKIAEAKGIPVND